MNRTDLQRLSNARIREATVLYKAHEYSGAYYLSGYAVPLKACFAKAVRRHDFPDKSARDIFVHRLPRLLAFAHLEEKLQQDKQLDPRLEAAWNVVVNWTEESRYTVWTRSEAKKLLGAIKGRGGMLPWIKQRW
jgi:hypothetical protein